MAVKAGRYRGMTADERVAARRAQLLDAALEVWGRDAGAEGPRVTMTAICTEAGLSERYFYESFTGLDALLAAVLEGIAQEIEDDGVAAIAAAQGGPAERVRAGLAAFVGVITDDPRKGRVLTIEAPGWPSLRPTQRALMRTFVDLVSREGRALYGAEALDERDAHLQALMFIGGIQELVTSWLGGEVDADVEEIVDSATFMFTRTGHR